MMTMTYFVLAAVLLSAFSVFKAQAWESVAYIQASQGCPSGLEPVTAGGRKMCCKTVDCGCSSVSRCVAKPKTSKGLVVIVITSQPKI